jgi:hypothetical protein
VIRAGTAFHVCAMSGELRRHCDAETGAAVAERHCLSKVRMIALTVCVIERDPEGPKIIR